MNKETRDSEILITSSWAADCHKLDLTEITVCYYCASGTVTILNSAVRAPDVFFANEFNEQSRMNDLLSRYGLKVESSGEHVFQYRIYELVELDRTQWRRCSSSVEAMRFLNSIAKVLGKKPDTNPRVVVCREVLINGSWVSEGKALCEESLK